MEYRRKERENDKIIIEDDASSQLGAVFSKFQSIVYPWEPTTRVLH